MDTDFHIWKTYMENRNCYQYACLWQKAEAVSTTCHREFLNWYFMTSLKIASIITFLCWLLTSNNAAVTLIYVSVTLGLRDKFIWHIYLTFAYFDALSSTLNQDRNLTRKEMPLSLCYLVSGSHLFSFEVQIKKYQKKEKLKTFFCR